MVIIYKNPNGDTRTAKKDVTYEEFQKANDMHRQDVKNVMNEIAYQIMHNGNKHDYTKKSFEKGFYNCFKDTLEYNINFVESDWYQLHIDREKHHPLSKCHKDITLLDIIEMIVDCVCAGKSRCGEVRDLEISDDILKLALKNTVKEIDNMVRVDE